MLHCVTMMLHCIILKSNVMDKKFSSVKFYIKKSFFLHLWWINVFRAEAQGDWGLYPLERFKWGDIATHISQFLTLEIGRASCRERVCMLV